MAYWFNVDKGAVEDDGNKSRGDQLMGPYASHEEAASALQSARQRTEAWDAEDKKWDDGDDA